jgi:hypothetical protein
VGQDNYPISANDEVKRQDEDVDIDGSAQLRIEQNEQRAPDRGTSARLG